MFIYERFDAFFVPSSVSILCAGLRCIPVLPGINRHLVSTLQLAMCRSDSALSLADMEVCLDPP